MMLRERERVREREDDVVFSPTVNGPPLHTRGYEQTRSIAPFTFP